MVWVRPGVLLVRARLRRPERALIALDLPTLERPAKAISGGPGGRRSPGRPAARRNSALENGCMGGWNSNKIPPFFRGNHEMLRALALAAGMLVLSANPAFAQKDAKPDL